MKSNFECKNMDNVGHCKVFDLNSICPFRSDKYWTDAEIICSKYESINIFEQISHDIYRYQIPNGRNTTLELYEYEWEALKFALNSNRTGMYFDRD